MGAPRHPRQRHRTDHGDDASPRQQLLADPDKRAAALSRIPSGRFATPEEIAAAVVYLASSGAASVTGVTLPVDGGLTAI